MSVVAFIFFCCSAGIQAAPRVAGGTEAPDGKYPYMVSLHSRGQQYCGGTILNERWILTAAHCVKGKAGLSIVAGTNGRKAATAGQVYAVERAVWSEDWDERGFVPDIGLVRLDRDIRFDDKLQPVQLPSEDFAGLNRTAVLVGWGRLSHGGPSSDALQEVELQVIEQDRCADLMDDAVGESHICTLSKPGEGACGGDSGSALVAEGVQIGIVSYGIAPCASGYPDVYTRVFSFLDWINEQISGV